MPLPVWREKLPSMKKRVSFIARLSISWNLQEYNYYVPRLACVHRKHCYLCSVATLINTKLFQFVAINIEAVLQSTQVTTSVFVFLSSLKPRRFQKAGSCPWITKILIVWRLTFHIWKIHKHSVVYRDSECGFFSVAMAKLNKSL